MIPIPIRRLCAACGSAFARLPGQPVFSFVRRLHCAPCVSQNLPAQTFTAEPADAPRPSLPILSGTVAAF